MMPDRPKLSCLTQKTCPLYTLRSSIVNSEIFASVFGFVKMKSSRNGEIILSFTDEGRSCHSREFLRRKFVY